MSAANVKRTMDVLCAYYANSHGEPVKLNDVQTTVYSDGLARFDGDVLEHAARVWMRQSRFFPKLSDLLELVEPQADLTTAAHLAWSAVERAIREFGAYATIRFEQDAIGEAVRQTFGTWPRACAFELDSPGWAIRRQTFLAIFPTLVNRDHGEVVLGGLHRAFGASVIPAIEGIPTRPLLTEGEPEPIGRREAAVLLEEIRQKALERKLLPGVKARAAGGGR